MLPTATTALESFRQGNLSAVELLQSYLDRITEREAIVGAWEYLNSKDALKRARNRDVIRTSEKDAGILQGIPIGIKDTFATAKMPTRWGTPIHHEQTFDYDATIVQRLRAEGAIILGKTVTSEYAMGRPGKTRNPHNLEHTPGASSSGSAAAVADGMVPVAIGTQMGGSILRPASYCGVMGFKPSFGVVSRYGLMPSCQALDQVGFFAQSIADIALILRVLAGVDLRDPDCCNTLMPASQPSFSEGRSPKFAFVLTPYWSQIETEAKEALLNSVNAFTDAGAIVTEINLPPEFDTYFDQLNVIAFRDMAINHGSDYDRHADQMSAQLCQVIERGRNISAIAYANAIQTAKDYRVMLSRILSEFDAILTPVTTGTAPYGLEHTGSPIFCALWTLCGLPAISIPAGKAKNGLPLGIQLVGRSLGDWDLLAIADWAVSHL